MISIVGMLAFLLFPAAVSVKSKALRVVDVSHLRQIGQARELYLADTGGTEKYQSKLIVEAGYADAKLFSSPLDPTERGLANVMFRPDAMSAAKLLTPYKDSYLCIYDQNGQEYIHDNLAKKPDFGWLASIADGQFRPILPEQPFMSAYPEGWGMFRGSYLRLRVDGSVVTKFKAFNHELRGDELFADQLDPQKPSE